MSLVQPAVRGGNGYAIHLTMGKRAADVRLEGVIDAAAAGDLSRLMDSLETLSYLPVEIDLSAVTALDGPGVQPLVDAGLRRAKDQRPPVLIGECSCAARHFLDAAEPELTYRVPPSARFPPSEQRKS